MRRSKKENRFLFLIILLLGLGIGYALISSDLTINGIGRFHNQSWDVHFEDLTLNPGNVELSQDDVAATINQTTLTDITFTVTLNEPGDFYEFEVAAVNAGTMDAMIGLVTNNLNGNPISETNPVPSYSRYTATYSDGVEIAPNHLLEHGNYETYKVRVEYRTDINPEDLPTEPEELTFTFGVEYIQKNNSAIDIPHPPTLYGVMEAEAKAGVYATTYTGAHQDSFAGTGNKKIYHWYAENDTNGIAITNRNNVIFAGHCWQMIRTTDTGGVKMIYNGEVDNNQCLNTRGNHAGYDAIFSQELNGKNENGGYYYGTDYTYDSINNTFTLAGTIEQAIWNETTGPTLIGKYTCKSVSESNTCATLYLLESYNTNTSARVIRLETDSHYSRFGNLDYNMYDTSPAYMGYMYNDVYLVTSKTNVFTVQDGSWTVNTSYYYSDTIDWNTTTPNRYTLLNPQQLSTLNGDYSSLVGKYVSNSSGTSSTQAKYIIGVSGTTLYYKSLQNGDLNTSLTIGDTYTESEGVYTLTGNVTNIAFFDWANNYRLYEGKYVCEGNTTTCSDIKHINPTVNQYRDSFYYFDSTHSYSYAENVSYDGVTYTLTGDIKTMWDIYDEANKTTISTHHYTCFSSGTSCTTVGYVYNIYRDLYYIQLTGVEDLDTALNNMLYASNVNTKNSTIKSGIEAWYAKYLSSYDSYIEDTIFCNNRTINSLGAWNPDGGQLNQDLRFEGSSPSKDLSCDRVTDQFSTLNNSAKLTYKVGLMSSPEMNLLNNDKIRKINSTYWLISPYNFSNSNSEIRAVWLDGSFGKDSASRNQGLGVRPAISLNPGIMYISGDGSMANPYLVDDGNNIAYFITIDNNDFSVPFSKPPGKIVTIYSDDYAVTSFKLNGTLVNGDTFVMPSEDVSITDIQYIQANYSITNTDSTIDVPTTGRYGSTITLSSNNYRVISFKLNGTLVNGNSFVMPGENVTITEINKITQVTIESEHNPYANNINNIVYYENTFSGASSITVELTYQTESTSSDWIYLYDDANATTPVGNKKYGGKTQTTETITINSDYIKVVFKTDSSVNDYYGFKAIITPNYS